MVLRHRSWLDLCGHQLPSNDKRHQDGLPVLRSTVALHHRSSLDDIKMAFACCDEQWCFTTNVCLIFVSTCFNQQLQTCPLSAAQCNGVVPCSSLTFGFKGFFSKFPSSINSLLVDAEIMRLGLLSIHLEKLQDHKHKLHWRRSKNLIIRDLGTIF